MRYVGHACPMIVPTETFSFLNRGCSLSNALPREHQGAPLQILCNVYCRGGACCSAADGTPLSFGHLPNGETPPETFPINGTQMRSRSKRPAMGRHKCRPLQIRCGVFRIDGSRRKETLAFIKAICYNNTVRKPSTVWISERQALYDSRS